MNKELISDFDTVERGRLAEKLVEYKLALHGIETFMPPSQTSGCDLLVNVNGSYYRCEVKSLSARGEADLHRLKTSKDGKRIHVPYDNVDFFIIVCLNTETVAIVPFNYGYMYRSARLTKKSKLYCWIDNYDFNKNII